MSYTHSEEVEYIVNGEEVSVSLFCDVNCIYGGAPASGPTYSSGGEPEEPPEFETETAYIVFVADVPSLTLSEEQLEQIFGAKFMQEFYDRAIEKASESYETDDEPDYDPDID